MVEKRDASTDLLRRLRGYMTQYNVDFIGVDFNTSAFSTVSDVFSDPEFFTLVICFCGDLVSWKSSTVSALGSSSCPSAHTSGMWIHMASTNMITLHSVMDPRAPTAHFPVFLHLRSTNLPGPDSIMRSERAHQRRFERRHNKHERMKRRRT